MFEEDSNDGSLIYGDEEPGELLSIGSPLISPSMRKLKHFIGLMARNLTLDLVLQTTIQNPDSKADSQNDNHKESNGTVINANEDAPKNALIMEQSLRTLEDSRLPYETFFSVNVSGREEPVYVSEIVKNACNPVFQEFELDPEVAMEKVCVVSVWGRARTHSQFERITCKVVVFQDLKFACDLTSNAIPELPENSLVIKLRDGYYLMELTSQGDDKEEEDDILMEGVEAEPTCSFNSILALSNLHQCIVDAESTKQRVSDQISTLINKQPSLFTLRKQRSQLQHALNIKKTYLSNQHTQIIKIQQKLASLKASMDSRRSYMVSESHKQRTTRRTSATMESSILTDKTLISHDQSQTQAEIARIVSQISSIFPIEPLDPFRFTICQVPLPDYSARPQPTLDPELVKSYGGISEEELIAAAYGFTSQVVTLLSYYLEVPLRYPIQPFGSQSFIIDPISTIQGSRTFPLWIKGSLYFRYQYATFLFVKDVEQLMCGRVIIVMDNKLTLANLKNLMLVLS